MPPDLLRLEEVERLFRTRHGVVRAVDGVSVTVGEREAVGLVGESGSGKSTLGLVALRMYDASGGRVIYGGQDITSLKGDALRRLRTRFQMVFQDPVSALDPRMRAGAIVAEPLIELTEMDREQRRQRVKEVLDLVHLLPSTAERYPRELSGGQAQRVGIARALVVKPELVVADEPISALDASVGAQIINLMAELQRSEGVAYLVITHDLSFVRHLCDRVAVMYLGRLVETAGTEQLFTEPHHPYTASLISATPNAAAAAGERRERIVLPGEIPDPTAVPSGCRFRTRCPIGPLFHPERTVCAEVDPPLMQMPNGGLSACHFAEEVPAFAASAVRAARGS